jgi:hypothetical protein
MDNDSSAQPNTFTLAGKTYPIAYDATISMARANGVALVLTPILLGGLIALYFFVWGSISFQPNLPQPLALLWLLFILILSIVIHEGLHALSFLLVGRVPLSALRFGFSWEGFAPYAHCQLPLTIGAYRISVVAPALVLGVLPTAVGLIIGSFGLLLYGAVMLTMAGGDFAVLLAVRTVPPGERVIDHPTAPGCHVLKAEGLPE